MTVPIFQYGPALPEPPITRRRWGAEYVDAGVLLMLGLAAWLLRYVGRS
jgi:hypothetical protein